MVVAATIENAHHYGDVIPSIYRLRHQGFKQRQSYDVPYFKDMEYDVYDTPATTYLAWRDRQKVVRGCTRLFPTTRPYMIEDLWPKAVSKVLLPKSPFIWECSRFCIDKFQPPEIRRKIHGDLLCAFQEYGLRENIDWMIGVMTPPIWKAVFIRVGWPVEFLGPVVSLNEKEKIVVGKMKISETILESLRAVFQITGPVLDADHPVLEQKRA